MPPITPRINVVHLLAGLAAVAWSGAATLMIFDASSIDLPDPAISLTGLVAATLTVIAVNVGVSYAAQKRIVTAVELVKDDTGNIPRITDTMSEVPQFTEWVTLVGELQAEVRVIGERQAWLLRDRGLLPPEPVENDPAVRDLTREAYRLGRRQRQAGND